MAAVGLDLEPCSTRADEKITFFSCSFLVKVEDLAKNRQPTDLTEPLQLLSDTKKLVNGVSELMGGGAGTPLS